MELPSNDQCSIARSLGVVGEKWTLLVLREAFGGVRRFGDLQARLGIPKAVLADRLATLVDAGLLRRLPYREPGARTRYEYRLTRKGIELYPALIALMRWGDKWLADDPQTPPLLLEHVDCGARVGVAIVCEAGHELPGAWEVRPVEARAETA